MKKLNFLLIVMLFVLSHSSQVFAGTEGKGGAIAFVCKSRILGIFPKTHVYLADSYALKETPIYYDLRRLAFSDPSRALADAIQMIRGRNAILGEVLAKIMGELQFSEVDTLPLLGDDGVVTPPKGCQKAQLGIQTFSTGVVQVNRELRRKISQIDEILFKLHEGYLRFLWKVSKGDLSIKRVREQVFDWARDPQFKEFLEASPARLIPEPVGACFLPTPGFSTCGWMPKSACVTNCRALGGDLPISVDSEAPKSCGQFIGGPCGGP